MARQPMSLRKRAVNKDTDKSGASEDSVSDEPMKRLTLDMPESLHRQLKMRAVMEGTTMAKLIRAWLVERVAE